VVSRGASINGQGTFNLRVKADFLPCAILPACRR
jgi:hypothetical protein